MSGFHTNPQIPFDFYYPHIPSLFSPPTSLPSYFDQFQNPPHLSINILFPFPNEIYLLPLVPYSIHTLCGSVGCSLVIIDLRANTHR